MSHFTNKPLSSDPIAVLKRRKWIIVLWPLACVVLGALLFAFFPRTYQSEARLFLRVGRESVGIDPTATTGQTMPLYNSNRKDEVKSAETVFQSKNVAAQVVDQLGADAILRGGDVENDGKPGVLSSVIRKPVEFVVNWIKSLDPISQREEAIIAVQRALFVDSEKDAPVVVIRYKASSPKFAQKVCQAVVKVGQQEHMRIHRNDEAHLFFEEQRERLRQQLDTSLEALRQAKDEMGLTDVQQRRKTLEAQYKSVGLERLTAHQAMATSQARIADLQQQLEKVPERLVSTERSVPNQGADLLRDRFYELQMKSMDLSARYNDTHPLVVAVNEQLKEAEAVLSDQADRRTETTDEVNPIHRELNLKLKVEKNILSGLEGRIAQLDQQREQTLVELRHLNECELKIDQLARDSELARDKYLQYARNLEEARIDQILESERISNVAMVQPATMSEKPVAPSRLVTAAGIFLLSIAGTVGLVLFAERENFIAARAAATRSQRPLSRRRRDEHAAHRNGKSPVAKVSSVK